jgi:probable F420-dependent oxidoreductase
LAEELRNLMAMHLGVTAFNVGNYCVPEFGQLAALMDELGYESLWTAEHIVLPDLPPGQAQRPGTMPIMDSIAIISYLAGFTTRLKFGTGVLLLPQHHPLLLAKQLASVDVLTRGRLIVGIGVGSVPEEAEAMAAPMSQRGRRANEYVEAMIAMWTMEHPRYSGRHISFDGINAYPRPVQKPHPPFVVGGRSEGAYRRTVRYCAGWFGFNMDLETTRGHIAGIAAAREKYGRPPELGEVEITVAPSEDLSRATIDAYAAAGVSRLLIRLPSGGDLADAEAVIRASAPANFGLELAVAT